MNKLAFLVDFERSRTVADLARAEGVARLKMYDHPNWRFGRVQSVEHAAIYTGHEDFAGTCTGIFNPRGLNPVVSSSLCVKCVFTTNSTIPLVDILGIAMSTLIIRMGTQKCI